MMIPDFDQLIDRRHTDSSKWRHYPEDVLPLWVADMDFRSPEPVLQALRERVEHGVFGYGVEPPELRPVVVERLARLYDWQVRPEEVMFLPGVVYGFNLACHAFSAPGDGVLVQTPVYPPILGAPLHARLTRNEMQLTRLPDGRYEIDFDVLEQATTPRTRLFILCNPHNPVGRVFSRGELEHLADVCLRHRLIICSDEIHCDLLFAGNRHIPIASLHPEIAQRTMTLMAPSKTYNISGLQCALAIVQNPELRRQLKAARDGLIPRPNLFGYAAALAGFRHGQPWLDQVVRYLEANCGWLLEAVDALLPGVRMTRPEATYLAWMDCRQAGIPGNPYEFFLSRAKVALNDGTSFGAGGEGFVRLNFGCPRSILVEAISRMQAALDEVKGSPQ